MNKPYITLRVFITEIIGYVVMLGAFLVATVKCITCDGEIVSHYNAAGEPDKYSNPGILFMPSRHNDFYNAYVLFDFAFNAIRSVEYARKDKGKPAGKEL